jgi:hypothetical protein
VQYLTDSSVSKEDLAKQIATRDKVDRGLVCVFTSVEPCWSFEIHRNRAAKKLQLQSRRRKCLQLYHLMIQLVEHASRYCTASIARLRLAGYGEHHK